MTKEDVLKVIKTERECVSRNDGVNCNRRCEKCDLVLPSDDILNAYDYVIKMLEREQPLSRSCNDCGKSSVCYRYDPLTPKRAEYCCNYEFAIWLRGGLSG